MLVPIKCNLNTKEKAYLNKVFGLAVSGEIKSHAVYVDTDSVKVAKDQALCMYDYADILLKEE